MIAMEEYQKNRFWNKYIEQLNKRAIKETAQRWYVIHVEQYVKSIPNKKLKYHTAENVSQYFSSTGQKKSIAREPVNHHSNQTYFNQASAPVDKDNIRHCHETFFAQVVNEIRKRHYSYRTEQTYTLWIVRYMDGKEIS